MFNGVEQLYLFSVQSHIGNIPIKFDWNWPRGVREVVIYGKLLMQHDA